MHAFRAAINPGCQVSEYIARMSAEKGGGGEEVAELLMSEMAIVGDDQLKDKKGQLASGQKERIFERALQPGREPF